MNFLNDAENQVFGLPLKKVPGKSKICPELSVLFIIRKAVGQTITVIMIYFLKILI